MATIPGAPPVTPYALMQALNQARRRGNPGDYYGLGAAARNVGQSYLDLNRQVQSAANTFNQNAELDARAGAGYYPAQAAMAAAQFGRNASQARQQQLEQEDVQQAFAQAKAQGLEYGTKEFADFMQSHVNSLHGARTTAPEVAAATQKVQNRAFAEKFVKAAVEREVVHRLAVRQFQALTADQSITPEVAKAKSKEAWQYAKDHLQEQGVQIDIGVDGAVSAKDKDGQAIEVPPQVVAASLMAMGNNVPAAVINMLSKEQRSALDQQTKNTLAAAGLDAKAKAAGGTPKAASAAGVGKEDPALMRLHKYHDALRAEKSKWEMAMGKTDPPTNGAEKIADLDKKIGALEAQLFPSLATPAGTKPAVFDPYAVSAAGAGVMGGAADPAVASIPSSYMYGMEPDDAVATPSLPVEAELPTDSLFNPNQVRVAW